MKNKDIILEECSIVEIYELMHYVISTYKFSSNFHLIGPTGIGKSSMAQQFFIDLNIKYIIIQMSLLKKERLKEMLEDFFKKHNDNQYGIILNELNHSSEELMSVIFELFDQRKIEDFYLPQNICIISTSNPEENKGLNKKILSPLMNRLFSYNIIPQNKDLFNYLGDSLHPAIKAFLIYYPNFLFDKNGYNFNLKNFSSPRNWEKTNIILNNLEKGEIKYNEKIFQNLLRGILGQIIADLFLDFIKTKDLRNYIYPNILLDFKTIIPKEPLIDQEIDIMVKRGYIYDLRDFSFYGKLKRNYYNLLIFLHLTTSIKIRNKYKIKRQDND